MNSQSIVAGGIYHDGKQGVREVLAIETEGTRCLVRYQLLAARQTTTYNWQTECDEPTAGSVKQCELASFAQWAKEEVPVSRLSHLLAELQGAGTRLSPQEAALLRSIAGSCDADSPFQAGVRVSFEPNEKRAALGLQKKRLVIVSSGYLGHGEVEVRAAAVGWLRAHPEPAAAKAAP